MINQLSPPSLYSDTLQPRLRLWLWLRPNDLLQKIFNAHSSSRCLAVGWIRWRRGLLWGVARRVQENVRSDDSPSTVLYSSLCEVWFILSFLIEKKKEESIAAWLCMSRFWTRLVRKSWMPTEMRWEEKLWSHLTGWMETLKYLLRKLNSRYRSIILLCMLLVFTVCWLPLNMINILEDFEVKLSSFTVPLVKWTAVLSRCRWRAGPTTTSSSSPSTWWRCWPPVATRSSMAGSAPPGKNAKSRYKPLMCLQGHVSAEKAFLNWLCHSRR